MNQNNMIRFDFAVTEPDKLIVDRGSYFLLTSMIGDLLEILLNTNIDVFIFKKSTMMYGTYQYVCWLHTVVVQDYER